MHERVRRGNDTPTADPRDAVRARTRQPARPAVQFRLTVGRADDPAEREADAVAALVLGRLADGAGRGEGEVATSPSRIQRSSAGDERGGTELATDGEHRLRTPGSVGGRASGSSDVLRRMEGAFGADFGGVRIHTGADVDVAADGLQARAFTLGRDVYIRRRDYRPGTSVGDELIAHELTHTIQQGGSKIRRRTVDRHDPIDHGLARTISQGGSKIRRRAVEPVEVRRRIGGSHLSLKKEKVHLDFIRMKRMDPQYSRIIGKMVGIDVGQEQSGGTYGHWWTEVGDLDPITNEFTYTDSYGWWPKDGVSGIGETFGGVEGALNADEDQDPHAGETAPTEFHPVMEVDTAKETYDQVRQRVITKVDSVAKSYKGKWHWRLGWGKNCHTFQQHLKTKAGIHYQKSSKWLYDPAAMALAQQKQQARQLAQQRRDAAKHMANEWHDVDMSAINVVDPTTNIERSIDPGGAIGKTGKQMRDLTGFECVEIATANGELAWILKSEWKSWTGKDWTP